MTKRKDAVVTPRQYDDTFKELAVSKWINSGQSAEATARELGVSVFQLYEWKRRGERLTRVAGASALPDSKEALQVEVQRLRREVLRLTEQRDILKKAAGILSEPPPSGMPGFRP